MGFSRLASAALLASGLTLTGLSPSAYSQPAGTVPLKLYYSDARGDNFTTATPDGERDAQAAGYRYVRVEGYLYPSPQTGTVPLKLYYSDQRQDNFTTATFDGERDAIAAGYRYVRVEGYLFPIPLNGTVPLKLYYSDQRRDNFTTTTPEGERDAQAAGYRYVRIEGYMYSPSGASANPNNCEGISLLGVCSGTTQGSAD